ncbi:MAG: type I pullulanase [Tepidisphaerales bacterium]
MSQPSRPPSSHPASPAAPTARRLLSIVVLLLGYLATLAGTGVAFRVAVAVARTPEVDIPQLAETLHPADYGAPALLVVHYHRPDGRYDDWNLWVWPEGQEGRAYPFTGATSFGRYAIIPWRSASERAGLIIRKGNWQAKDIDRDRFVATRASGVTEVWVVSGDETLYLDPAKVDLSVKPVIAFLDSRDLIVLATTGVLDEASRQQLTVQRRGQGTPPTVPAAVEQVELPAVSRVMYHVRLPQPVSLDEVARLQLKLPGHSPLTVYARGVLETPELHPLDARLGYDYSSQATTFTTWSPVSELVELVLFRAVGDREPARVIPLRRGEMGLWSVRIEGDLHGVPYRYRFHSYGKVREVVDIHTVAASSDSSYGLVMDLARLAPEGWGSVPQPRLNQPTDEVIYEIHVRDFSIADEAAPPHLRGTYLGLLTEHPRTASTPSTGLSHLLDLGVTAVHLLPIHDFTAKIGEYNWGYWTALFNVPEANYATDPHDPARPILELRTAIQGLHRAGIRVILDVVYNHTSSSGEHSPFDQTVPYYFFRTSADGKLLNDAGVGNSIADERAMVRKYILDSLQFWVEQYRVDGFRFDLLGTHHPATVKAIQQRLLPLRPDLTLYGEPWTGGGHTHFPKGAQKGMRVAVFNDHFRHALRGDLDGTSTGFATGSGGDLENVRRGIAGAIDDFTEHPIETVNYVSAHDNLILWDKLRKAHPKASDEELKRYQKLSQAVVLLSQGIAFLHGGCDFARTKHGNHNSYNAGDEVNKFDWPRKQRFIDVHDYLAGMIRLRKAHPVLRLTTREQVREVVQFSGEVPHGVVAYTLDGSKLSPAATTLFVALNGGAEPAEVQLPEGTWTLLTDDRRAGTEPLGEASGKVKVAPRSLMVLRR